MKSTMPLARVRSHIRRVNCLPKPLKPLKEGADDDDTEDSRPKVRPPLPEDAQEDD
jgi:hypothetical protein